MTLQHSIALTTTSTNCMLSPLKHLSYQQQKEQHKIPTTTCVSPQNIITTTTIGLCSSPVLLSTELSSPTSSIHSPPINNTLHLKSLCFQTQQQSNLNSTTLKKLDLSINIKDEIKEPINFSTTTMTPVLQCDQEIRSMSVKAESCYENLSSESDFEDENITKNSPTIINNNLSKFYKTSIIKFLFYKHKFTFY